MAPFDKKQLRGEVSALSWFHRIDLGHGVTTPGIDNTPSKIRKMHIPKRLEGKTVIDIGAWNGAYSFECERRGAKRVLATDWYCWQGEGKQGFDLAKRVFGQSSRGTRNLGRGHQPRDGRRV